MHTEKFKRWKVENTPIDLYLISNNTILNKVAPCRYRIASITPIAAHKTAACQQVID